jgi:hypothetical protein
LNNKKIIKKNNPDQPDLTCHVYKPWDQDKQINIRWKKSKVESQTNSASKDEI